MSCTSASIRCDPPAPSVAIELGRQVALCEQARAQGVVDVVVDVRHAIHHPHDPPLRRARLARAARVAQDAVAHLLGQVQPGPVALQPLDHPQRVLVVAKAPTEALAQAAIQDLLADVPERRVPQVVPHADRLRQVLVEAQRARHGPRDRRDLERVRQPRAVVVPLGRHEHLRLVRQAAKGLAVHDPVAVALKWGAQRAVGLLPRSPCRVGARRQRREGPLLQRFAARREGRPDRVDIGCRAHLSIVAAPPAHADERRPVHVEQRSALAMPVVAAGDDVHPVAPALLLVRILVVDGRAVLGPGERQRRGRLDAQIDAAFVDRRDDVGRDEANAAGGLDQETVKDVLGGVGQHAPHGPDLLAVAREHRHAVVEQLIGDRQTLVHSEHDTDAAPTGSDGAARGRGQAHVRVVLERLGDRPLDLPERLLGRLRSLGQRAPEGLRS